LSKPKIRVVDALPVDKVKPNPWNPNRLPDWMMEKLRKAIQRFGFTDPIFVRVCDDPETPYELIDGEHRWRVAKELGIRTVPAVIMEGISVKEAEALTLLSNELKGQADPQGVLEIVKDLQPTDLIDYLPYDDKTLKWLIESFHLADIVTFSEQDVQAGIETLMPSKARGSPKGLTEPRIMVNLPAEHFDLLEAVRLKLEQALGITIGVNNERAVLLALKAVSLMDTDLLRKLLRGLVEEMSQ